MKVYDTLAIPRLQQKGPHMAQLEKYGKKTNKSARPCSTIRV